MMGSPPSTPPAYRTPPAGAMPQTVITPSALSTRSAQSTPSVSLLDTPAAVPTDSRSSDDEDFFYLTTIPDTQVSQIPTDTSVVSFKDGSLSVPPHSPEMMDNHLNTPCVSPVMVFSREDTPTPSRPPSPSGAKAVNDTPQLMLELVARLNGVAGKWESKGKDPAEGSSKADGDGFKTVRNKRRRKTMLWVPEMALRYHLIELIIYLLLVLLQKKQLTLLILIYINSSSLVSSCKIDRVGRKGVKFQSFHVTIDTDNIKEILTPDFWPSGIAVRRYFI